MEQEPPEVRLCRLELNFHMALNSSQISFGGRVAAKIFVFVFSRKFREIISFVFSEIFLQFREIFAKHEIKICAKFSRKSKEISRNTKQEITLTSFFKNSLPKSIEKFNFSENPK